MTKCPRELPKAEFRVTDVKHTALLSDARRPANTTASSPGAEASAKAVMLSAPPRGVAAPAASSMAGASCL